VLVQSACRECDERHEAHGAGACCTLRAMFIHWSARAQCTMLAPALSTDKEQQQQHILTPVSAKDAVAQRHAHHCSVCGTARHTHRRARTYAHTHTRARTHRLTPVFLFSILNNLCSTSRPDLPFWKPLLNVFHPLCPAHCSCTWYNKCFRHGRKTTNKAHMNPLTSVSLRVRLSVCLCLFVCLH
jgi:hypothetical protein